MSQEDIYQVLKKNRGNWMSVNDIWNALTQKINKSSITKNINKMGDCIDRKYVSTNPHTRLFYRFKEGMDP